MADENSFATVGNVKTLNKLYQTGKVQDSKSGWNSETFPEPYKFDPVVLGQGEDSGVTVEIRNVSLTGFDYRVLLNGADVDGKSFVWFAYVKGISSNAIVDEINSILGTEFTSVSEITGSTSNLDSVCSNKQASDVLFYYEPAINDISGNGESIDTVLGNSVSWGNIDEYSVLKSSIKSTEMGNAKLIYRKYSGVSNTSPISSYEDLFGSDEMATMVLNDSFLNEVINPTEVFKKLILSDVALLEICKNSNSRIYWNKNAVATGENRTVIMETLSSSYLFRTQDTANISETFDTGATYSFNASNPTGEESYSLEADACFFTVDSMRGNYYTGAQYSTLKDGDENSYIVSSISSTGSIKNTKVLAGGAKLSSVRNFESEYAISGAHTYLA